MRGPLPILRAELLVASALFAACSETSSPAIDASIVFADASADAGFPPDATNADAEAEADAGPIDRGPRPRIVFSSGAGGPESDLFLAELDGTHVDQLTEEPGLDGAPSWSPDGTRIAFSSNRRGRFGIYVFELASRTATAVSLELLTASGPAYSPDGDEIVFQGRASAQTAFDIYVISSTGGAARQLTTDAASDSGPAWSPDGRTIYFVSDRSGTFEVYAMDAGGSNQRVLTTMSLVIGGPTAGSDAIYYATGDDQQTIIVRFDLTTRLITPLTDDRDAEPFLSPDGTQLAFSTQRFGDSELMILDLAGGEPRRITRDPAIDGAPAIGPPID